MLVKSWTCPPPRITADRILRVHKYRDVSSIRPIIRKAAEEVTERVLDLALPDARYIHIPIKSLDNRFLKLEHGITFESEAFQRHLTGCDHLLAFVMTIGPALDETVMSLVDDAFEPLEALFLETAGWLTIERATKLFATHLKAEYAALGYKLSLRMGPGYDYPAPIGDGRVTWDLWQQKELFEMFGEKALPVTLSEMCAMSPKMSRSGVFGITKKFN